MDINKLKKSIVVGTLWVFIFIGILMVSRNISFHLDNHLFDILYILITLIIGISFFYVISMKVMGYRIVYRVNPRSTIVYTLAAILIFIMFYLLGITKVEINFAKHAADFERVLTFNMLYTIIGVAIGILFNFKGLLNIIKGRVRINFFIVPAFVIMFIGSIYSNLYLFSEVQFGIVQGGLLGALIGVFKIIELELVFLILSGFLLVRGSEHRI